MNPKMERTAAAVGRNQEVAEKLDEILSSPNDRAYVICSFEDCKSNLQGRCTVYTVMNVPRMKTSERCDGFEGRGAESGAES